MDTSPDRPADPTATARRRLLAVAMVAAPTLLALGSSLVPRGAADQVTSREAALDVLGDVAGGRVGLYWGLVTAVFGFGLLAVAFAGVAALVRRRGAALATTGAVLGGIGALCAVALLSSAVMPLVFLTDQDVARDQAATVAEQFGTGGPGIGLGAFALPFLGLVPLGSILLGVGLGRARVVPVWLAVLFPVTVIAATVGPAGPVGGLLGLPAIAVLVLLARRLLTAGEDAPQPVPATASSV